MSISPNKNIYILSSAGVIEIPLKDDPSTPLSLQETRGFFVVTIVSSAPGTEPGTKEVSDKYSINKTIDSL